MVSVAEETSHVDNKDVKEKKIHVWRKFWPNLARQLNAKEPDIMASTILYGLNAWMLKGNELTRIEGGNCCYRSLSDLASEHPYWTESGIEHALNRAESKLGGEFTIRSDKKCFWFFMTPKLRKRLNKMSALMFKIEDAVKYDVVKAILLSNIRWQFQQPRKFEQDEYGNKYAEVSPTKLTKPDPDTGEPIIPKSYKTISRALSELRTVDKVLVKHPTKASFYTFADNMIHATKNDNRNGTERDSDRTKRDTHGTIRDDFLCAHSNNIVNKDSKDNSFADLASAAPSQGSDEKISSQSLIKLMKLANDHLEQFRSDQIKKATLKPARVSSSLLPYDDFTGVEYDLPYDDIPVRVKGHITLSSQEIDQAVEIIKSNWRAFDIHYTKQNLVHLRQLFADNPSFKVEHWEEIESAIATARSLKQPDRNKWINGKIIRKVKTAASRLRYLPQIIYEMFYSSTFRDSEGRKSDELNYHGETPEPFRSIDYSYLSKSVNSKLIENCFNAGGLN